ncbi:MAG: hypothetical protein J5496_08330 [Lachnospiraceae bacterium]|nr:hypothetical protein [Lachnospiraceae bacterium]
MTNKEMKRALYDLRDKELAEIDRISAQRLSSETGEQDVGLKPLPAKEAAEVIPQHRRSRGLRFRRSGIIAAMIALLLLIAGITLGPRAYAQVQAWIKGKAAGPDGVLLNVVSVAGGKEPGAAVIFRLEWIPERFDLREGSVVSGSSASFSYTERIPWEEYIALPNVHVSGWYGETPAYEEITKTLYIAFAPGSINMYFLPDEMTARQGDITVGDWQVSYFLYDLPQSAFDCAGLNEKEGVAMRMSGDITVEEAIKIIENIRPE